MTAPPPNQAPTAAFTRHRDGPARCRSTGPTSTDADGTIASYSWNWGDGTPAPRVPSATATHTYATAGTYTITLTVTDNDGAPTPRPPTVTVTAPPFLARDDFGRTVANGWGSAEVGGAWTVGGPADRWSVDGGRRQRQPQRGQRLHGLAQRAVGGVLGRRRLNVGGRDKVATGGGQYVSVIGRRVAATTDYRAKVQITSTGTVSPVAGPHRGRHARRCSPVVASSPGSPTRPATGSRCASRLGHQPDDPARQGLEVRHDRAGRLDAHRAPTRTAGLQVAGCGRDVLLPVGFDDQQPRSSSPPTGSASRPRDEVRRPVGGARARTPPAVARPPAS